MKDRHRHLSFVNCMGRIKANARPVLFVSLVASIGLLLAVQGWNSRNLNVDLLPYIEDAHEFIALERVPEKGTLTSFFSYTPPGITWLMIPGVYWFSDPRLAESIGCAFLYIGTLFGIFFLTRDHLGPACAYLVVALWGLSELGLFFAATSGARSHPFFYIWMAYCTGKWIERDNAWYLAASVVIWAVGMYVFLEIAPAIFMIPVVWIMYRPSVQIWPLALGALLITVIWYPYLQFERTRGFIDLKSQILRERIWPASFKDAWCEPNLAPRSWVAKSDRSQFSNSREHGTLLTYTRLVAERAYLILTLLLLSNFNHTAKIPGTNLVLLLMTIAGLVMLFFDRLKNRTVNVSVAQINWRFISKWCGIAGMLAAIFLNEFVIARYLSLDESLATSTISTIRVLQAILMMSGILLLTARNNAAIRRNWLRMAARFDVEDRQHSRNAGLIAIVLVVPWMILLLLTEPYRLERFWWLWPLQIVSLASLVTYLPLRLGLPRSFIWIGSLLLVLVVAGNSTVISRTAAWVRDGWSGQDSDMIKVVDYTARQIGSENKYRAAIGYDLYIYAFIPVLNAVDPRYKVGADFDLLFKYRRGIHNVNRCAEGVSRDDEYRIIQTSTRAVDQESIHIPADDRFYLLRQFDVYQVFRRSPHSVARGVASTTLQMTAY